MLPAENRLKRQEDFQRVRKAGTKCGAGSFLVAKCPSDQDVSRVGLVVGGKIGLSAVERNRLRRCLFAAIEPVINWDSKPCSDIVVVTVKRPEVISTEAFSRELSQCLKKSS